MNDVKPEALSTKPTLATVGSTVTVVAGILGTVGVTAGVITALLRNEKALTLIAIFLVGVGVLAGVASALFGVMSPSRRHPRWRPDWAAILSIVLVGVECSVSCGSPRIRCEPRTGLLSP